MKSFRDIRVIPVVLVAIFGLMVLKIAGLVITGGYVFDYNPRPAKRSWAQENFNFPGHNRAAAIVDRDITGSTHGAPKEEKRKRRRTRPSQPSRRRNRTASWFIRPSSSCRPSRRRSGRSSSGCRRAARNWRPARARGRYPRKPVKGRRETHRVAGRGGQGDRSEGLGRERPEGRGRCRALQGYRHHV